MDHEVWHFEQAASISGHGRTLFTTLNVVLRLFLKARYNGYCNSANMVTGRTATQYIKVVVRRFFIGVVSIRVEVKARLVTATEKKREVKPRVSFRGREWRKSSSSYGEERMERNMASDISELAMERASVMMKTTKKGLSIRMGWPFLPLLPPGMVKAAAKATEAISAATKEHELEVRSSHFCASSRSSPWVRPKYSIGVSSLLSSQPSLLTEVGGIILPTFCKLKNKMN